MLCINKNYFQAHLIADRNNLSQSDKQWQMRSLADPGFSVEHDERKPGTYFFQSYLFIYRQWYCQSIISLGHLEELVYEGRVSLGRSNFLDQQPKMIVAISKINEITERLA